MTGLCLHIGCGLIIAENWYNIDASPTLRLSKLPIFGPMMAKTLKLPHWSSNAHYGNIVKGLNLKSNSCDLIYASHVLEHLTLTDFHTAMDHIYSYLKPGGVFRAIVPDLGNLIATYIQEQQDPELAIQAAGNLMQNSLMGHLGSRKSLLSRLKESLANNRHQWMWDSPALKNAFVEHGFQQVRICEYGDWPDSRFAEVEHPESFIDAFGVEGVK